MMLCSNRINWNRSRNERDLFERMISTLKWLRPARRCITHSSIHSFIHEFKWMNCVNHNCGWVIIRLNSLVWVGFHQNGGPDWFWFNCDNGGSFTVFQWNGGWRGGEGGDDVFYRQSDDKRLSMLKECWLRFSGFSNSTGKLRCGAAAAPAALLVDASSGCSKMLSLSSDWLKCEMVGLSLASLPGRLSSASPTTSTSTLLVSVTDESLIEELLCSIPTISAEWCVSISVPSTFLFLASLFLRCCVSHSTRSVAMSTWIPVQQLWKKNFVENIMFNHSVKFAEFWLVFFNAIGPVCYQSPVGLSVGSRRLPALVNSPISPFSFTLTMIFV